MEPFLGSPRPSGMPVAPQALWHDGSTCMDALQAAAWAGSSTRSTTLEQPAVLLDDEEATATNGSRSPVMRSGLAAGGAAGLAYNPQNQSAVAGSSLGGPVHDWLSHQEFGVGSITSGASADFKTPLDPELSLVGRLDVRVDDHAVAATAKQRASSRSRRSGRQISNPGHDAAAEQSTAAARVQVAGSPNRRIHVVKAAATSNSRSTTPRQQRYNLLAAMKEQQQQQARPGGGAAAAGAAAAGLQSPPSGVAAAANVRPLNLRDLPAGALEKLTPHLFSMGMAAAPGDAPTSTPRGSHGLMHAGDMPDSSGLLPLEIELQASGSLPGAALHSHSASAAVVEDPDPEPPAQPDACMDSYTPANHERFADVLATGPASPLLKGQAQAGRVQPAPQHSTAGALRPTALRPTGMAPGGPVVLVHEPLAAGRGAGLSPRTPREAPVGNQGAPVGAAGSPGQPYGNEAAAAAAIQQLVQLAQAQAFEIQDLRSSVSALTAMVQQQHAGHAASQAVAPSCSTSGGGSSSAAAATGGGPFRTRDSAASLSSSALGTVAVADGAMAAKGAAAGPGAAPVATPDAASSALSLKPQLIELQGQVLRLAQAVAAMQRTHNQQHPQLGRAQSAASPGQGVLSSPRDDHSALAGEALLLPPGQHQYAEALAQHVALLHASLTQLEHASRASLEQLAAGMEQMAAVLAGTLQLLLPGPAGVEAGAPSAGAAAVQRGASPRLAAGTAAAALSPEAQRLREQLHALQRGMRSTKTAIMAQGAVTAAGHRHAAPQLSTLLRCQHDAAAAAASSAAADGVASTPAAASSAVWQCLQALDRDVQDLRGGEALALQAQEALMDLVSDLRTELTELKATKAAGAAAALAPRPEGDSDGALPAVGAGAAAAAGGADGLHGRTQGRQRTGGQPADDAAARVQEAQQQQIQDLMAAVQRVNSMLTSSLSQALSKIQAQGEELAALKRHIAAAGGRA